MWFFVYSSRRTFFKLAFYCKAFDKDYNFALDFASIESLHTKLWAPQVMIPTLGMTFGCWSHDQTQNILQGGMWWLPLSPGRGKTCQSCDFVVNCGEFVHRKYSSYVLTNLFGLCKFMWVINLFVNPPSPNPRASARPSTLKVLRTKEHTPTPSVIFTFKFTIESIKELGGASMTTNNSNKSP